MTRFEHLRYVAEKVSSAWIDVWKTVQCFRGRGKCRGEAFPVPTHLLSVPRKILADVGKLGDGEYIMYLVPDVLLNIVYVVGVEDNKVHIYEMAISGSSEAAYMMAVKACKSVEPACKGVEVVVL